MNDAVSYESKDRIATVTITRGAKLNALNNDVINGLRDAWIRFEHGDDRVAILTAEGDRAFSVGADLKDPPAEMWEGVPGVGVEVTKPVIAAVFGHCVGGAYVLVQHCDLAVVADDTKFTYPEAKVGFTGGLCAGAVARVPHKVAMEFLLLGDVLPAQRAYEIGMVNQVVPAGSQVDTARAPSPSEKHAHARRELLAVNRSSDGQEGRAAFQEKRRPEFTGQ